MLKWHCNQCEEKKRKKKHSNNKQIQSNRFGIETSDKQKLYTIEMLFFSILLRIRSFSTVGSERSSERVEFFLYIILYHWCCISSFSIVLIQIRISFVSFIRCEFYSFEFQWHTFKLLSPRILSSIRIVDDNDNLPEWRVEREETESNRDGRKKKHLKGHKFFDTTSFSF